MFTVVVYVEMLSATLNEHAGFWMIFSMVGSALITAPMSWLLAPRVNGKLRKKLVAERSPLADAPSRSF